MKSVGNEIIFRKWQKQQDQMIINKLSKNLLNMCQGMNTNGHSNSNHAQIQDFENYDQSDLVATTNRLALEQ